MNFLITGGNGFVGSALCKILIKKNHKIYLLHRDDFFKDPSFLINQVEIADVIINLAGANISQRWNKKHKEEMYNSRINTTKAIVNAIAESKKKPNLLISASAVGFYDNEKIYDEEHFLPTNSFLGDLCSDWETMAMRASKNTRVVVFRFGVILGRKGGLIKKTYSLFKLGLGAVMGSGRQPMSWIHISDVLNAIQFAMKNKNLSGIYNLCSPIHTSNKDFSSEFAQILKKPLFLKIPTFVLKFIYGEGSKVITDGQRVKPNRLLNEGFNFRYPDIHSALNEIVNRRKIVLANSTHNQIKPLI